MSAPLLTNVKRHAGIAGQFSVTADVTYEGEGTRRIEFVGSSYGGPVVMVTDHVQQFVTNADRFGEFGEGWVRSFFGVCEHRTSVRAYPDDEWDDVTHRCLDCGATFET